MLIVTLIYLDYFNFKKLATAFFPSDFKGKIIFQGVDGLDMIL